MQTYYLVDVEAFGISPIGGTMTEFGMVQFDTLETFHGKIWESVPDPNNPAIPLPTNILIEDLNSVMARCDAWIKETTVGRPVFVSDNNGYDYQWINAAFAAYSGVNPFGHSSRRISDFYAGLTGDFKNTQAWKKLRITPHTHNPVDDAMGNAEALRRLFNGERP